MGADRYWYETNLNDMKLMDFQFMLCVAPGYKVLSPIGTLKVLIIQSTRPISIWLAILMALISCNSPRKALRYSEYIIVLSSEYVDVSEFRKTHEYFIRIIPALFYPLLTVPLLIQLWRIRKNRKVNSPKSDKTTVLILFMTLSFMLSEGLAGISNFIENSIYTDFRFWLSGASLSATAYSEVFNNLRSFNALSHFFVCVLMSSQYRDTVKKMFCGCKYRKEKVVMVQEAYSRSLKSFNSVHSRSF
ncbi:unnamed protein product [Caenorhabditis brenneri]